MNVLVLSDTFPNAMEPWRGPYNRRQVESLAKCCKVTVIDPLPWPSLLRDARLRGLTKGPDDILDPVKIYHPAFWYAPVIGRAHLWRGLLAGCKRVLPELNEKFDIILATFAYPHGMAARRLSRELGVPYAIKARGTDLHGLPPKGARRELTAEALRDAALIAAVSRNLADIALELGANPEKTHVITNGIDAEKFSIISRAEARAGLNVPYGQRILLFVGSLLPIKGLDIALEALALIPAAERPMLVIAGEGPLRTALERQANALGLMDRVRFVGRLNRERVGRWMNAADASILASRNEGCPNVVLESLACGTPVVAARVGAVPDLLDKENGVIAEPENPRALAEAIREVIAREWDRQAVRQSVQHLSWKDNARRLYELLRQAAGIKPERPSGLSYDDASSGAL